MTELHKILQLEQYYYNFIGIQTFVEMKVKFIIRNISDFVQCFIYNENSY